MSIKGLDSWITGHGGEDSVWIPCIECGTRFDPALRAESLGSDIEPEDIDTCSPACDRTYSYRLESQIQDEAAKSVPENQTERECIENGGWYKKPD